MKTKAQKQIILQKLQEQIAKTSSLVFVDISGLAMKDITHLRANLKNIGAKLQVAKKTLLQKALEQGGIKINLKAMAGEIAAIFSVDSFAALKMVHSFSKINEHAKLRGAYLEGTVHQETAMLQLAQLPSKQELLACFLATVCLPLYGFMNVLQGNTKGLVFILAHAKMENSNY